MHSVYLFFLYIKAAFCFSRVKYEIILILHSPLVCSPLFLLISICLAQLTDSQCFQCVSRWLKSQWGAQCTVKMLIRSDKAGAQICWGKQGWKMFYILRCTNTEKNTCVKWNFGRNLASHFNSLRIKSNKSDLDQQNNSIILRSFNKCLICITWECSHSNFTI